MMGTKLRRCAPIDALTLDGLVPIGSFYRRLDSALDLSFVRELVADCYAAGGRPSIDPIVFFKLQLVMFFEGIRSERQLLTLAADRLSVRWFLGYDLDEPLPDHSSLTRIRDRYGIDIFQRFFEQIVTQCQAAGLVWGRELYIDATKVAANADLDSLVERAAVDTHLQQVFGAPAAPTIDVDRDGCIIQLPLALDRMPPDPSIVESDWLTRLGRPEREHTSGSYQRTADVQVSLTDADATPMRTADGRTRLGYQDHYVVDGDRARIILSVLVAPAEVQENQPALDLLWRARFRWQLHPRQITGDTKYGTIENIAAIERQGIHAYVPLSAVGHHAGLFRDTDFIYDVLTDTYQCPSAVTLTFRSQCNRTHRRIYQAPAAACRACALREQCTTSTRGRRIGRSLDEDYVDRVRGYVDTEPYEKALRKRQVWVEPLFAEAKQWHGLERFRLRGLPKVNSEALLIATGQNLKRLLSRRGWGRRPFPSGAAGLRLAGSTLRTDAAWR
jgi:transposase